MIVCTLQDGKDIPVTVLTGEGEFIRRAPIGFDVDTGATYSVFVAFALIPGQADIPGYELIFHLIESQFNEEHIRPIWDGLESKAIFPNPADRRAILAIICMLVRDLIDAAGPGVVSMTTHSPNLPSKALEKYEQIAMVFVVKGYKAGQADPWNGQRIWMMQKAEC